MGDSAMGVICFMGLAFFDDRRRFLDFSGACSGSNGMGMVTAEYMRGGAGASSRNGRAFSSVRSSRKRSKSLMCALGMLLKLPLDEYALVLDWL
jgi:hypothetical protein